MLRIAWLLQTQSSLYLLAQTKVIIMINSAQLPLNKLYLSNVKARRVTCTFVNLDVSCTIITTLV